MVYMIQQIWFLTGVGITQISFPTCTHRNQMRMVGNPLKFWENGFNIDLTLSFSINENSNVNSNIVLEYLNV